MRSRFLLVLILLNAFVGFAVASSAAATPDTPTEAQMAAWWADLAKSDPEASRALLNFSSYPAQAVAFFKHKLRPLKVDPDIIQALLTQLASSKESEWKQAFDDLEYFDPRLVMDLPTLMDQVGDSPARQRLAEILIDLPPGTLAGKKVTLRNVGSNWYNFDVRDPKSAGSSSAYGVEGNLSRVTSTPWMNKPKWTRSIRAIVLLEHIGTSDAVAIIQDMAAGNPEAQPTKVAEDARTRLHNQ
jgi:hypothetical protein